MVCGSAKTDCGFVETEKKNFTTSIGAVITPTEQIFRFIESENDCLYFAYLDINHLLSGLQIRMDN